MKTVDVKTVSGWLKEGRVVLVDVREPSEYASEHIEGSFSLPLRQVSCAAMPAAEGKVYAMQCRSGKRSAQACAALLAENPAVEVYNVEGGIQAWMAEGLPVKTGKAVLPLDRQVQLTVGLVLLVGGVLAWTVHPLFVGVSLVCGAGLTLAGSTGFCGLGLLLARMPWNQRGGSVSSSCSVKA